MFHNLETHVNAEETINRKPWIDGPRARVTCYYAITRDRRNTPSQVIACTGWGLPSGNECGRQTATSRLSSAHKRSVWGTDDNNNGDFGGKKKTINKLKRKRTECGGGYINTQFTTSAGSNGRVRTMRLVTRQCTANAAAAVASAAAAATTVVVVTASRGETRAQRRRSLRMAPIFTVLTIVASTAAIQQGHFT
uniref:Uncharacterized protein n=1 Tax=Sipha flava TaxID=143950 RepID=A0A2S2QX72_9HEMI